MTRDDMNRDEEWEDIVRRLGGTEQQAQSKPASEDNEPQPSEGFVSQSLPQAGPRDYTLAEEEIEDFEPPEPNPFATGNPRTILSWSVVIGSVILWILAALGGWQLPWWLSVITLLGFFGGGLSLFFLLPKTWAHRGPSDDDDYGNGAKV